MDIVGEPVGREAGVPRQPYLMNRPMEVSGPVLRGAGVPRQHNWRIVDNGAGVQANEAKRLRDTEEFTEWYF